MTDSPAGPSARGRWDALFGLGLFTVALLPRLWVALAWAAEPVWDGHYYHFGAQRIAEGHGYSDDRAVHGLVEWHPWCHYPVGYSGFLALFYRVFGADPRVAGVVNACIGALLAVVTWRLAAHAMGPARGRVAGAIVALHPGLIVYAGLLMTEPLAALATLTAFWVAVRDRRPIRGLILGALLLGAGALVRPQALLCAPFLVLPVWSGLEGPRRWPRAIGAAAAACAIALVPVLPWTARNCRVMDGCALVSTNAGWNLAIGAFPRATGRFEFLRSEDGCREVTGQVQQDRCWLEYGVQEIRAHPLRWLALVPKKLAYTFDHESFAVEYLHQARPAAWPERRRALARDVTTLAHRLLVVMAALGVVAFRLPSRGSRAGWGPPVQGALLALVLGLAYHAFASPEPTFWPLVVCCAVAPWLPWPGRAPWPPALRLPLVLLVSTIVTHAVFFGEDRYHVVVTPVLALLAASALRREVARA